MEEIQMVQRPCKNKPEEIRADLCLTEAATLTGAMHDAVIKRLGPALAAYGSIKPATLPARPGRYSAGLLLTPEGLSPGENGQPGVSVTFGDSPTPPDDLDMLQSLSQTWQWDEAEEAVPAAPFRVTVRSVNSLELPAADRIALVQKTLYVLTEALRPAALLFPQSQCCIDPASYLENDPDGEDYFSIYGLVNTRVFTAEEEEDRNVFMDTIGMHVLGLPDAQCLVDGEKADFAELAYWLYNLAEYMRETPGEFEDGDIIIGLNDEEWELSYTSALIEPDRCVVNVDAMQSGPDDLNDELNFLDETPE